MWNANYENLLRRISTGWGITCTRFSCFTEPLVLLLQISHTVFRAFCIGFVLLIAIFLLCGSTMFTNVRCVGIWRTWCVDGIVLALTDCRMSMWASSSQIKKWAKRYAFSEYEVTMLPVLLLFCLVAGWTQFSSTQRLPLHRKKLFAGLSWHDGAGETMWKAKEQNRRIFVLMEGRRILLWKEIERNAYAIIKARRCT